MSLRSSETEITLDIGDGGEATLHFLRNEIITRFGNPILNLMEDGSWVEVDKTKIIVTTDSYIVDPPIFPGGDIGKLAISGTINDLLASGANPRYLTLSLVVTEKFPFSKLRHILDSAQRTALSADIQIIAGDTKVLDKKASNGIYLNTTGIGFPIVPDKNFAVSNACPGDKIILTGSVGDHGFAILSAREGLGFEQRIQSDCAPLNELIIPLIRKFEGVRCLRDPTRGGLVCALIDIAEASRVDIHVDENTIPIKKEVRFGCEMLGLDPLNLVNEGKMVIVSSANQASEILSQLCQHSLGSESLIIGTVHRASSSPGRLILKNNQVKRVVTRPYGLPLPRLC